MTIKITPYMVLFINGAPNPNIYEPLCKVIDYVIMNPAWRPTYVLVDRVIDFQSSDFNY